jgi:hypothetical protein
MDRAKEGIVNEVHEGRTTRAIEKQTAKIPSVGYLALAVGSMALSAATALIYRKRDLGNFFGLWAPSLLLLGVYNKIVKLEASLERETRYH